MSASSALRLHNPQVADGGPPIDWSRPTVAMVLDWYRDLSDRDTDSEAAETERRRIWSIVSGHIGQMLVAQCRRDDLRKIIKQQEGVESEHTKQRWAITIQAPFNKALDDELIQKNPFRGVRFKCKKKGRAWSQQECDWILRRSRPDFRRPVVCMMLTGMRPEEAFELRWAEVRLDVGEIHLPAERTKTRQARVVPMVAELAAMLAEIRAEQQATGKISLGRVFLNSRKKPWTREHADGQFRRLRTREKQAPDLKLHGIRHTVISQGVASGAAVPAIARLVGHDDLATTIKTYTHLADATLRDAAERSAIRLPKKQQEPTPLFDGLE